MKRCFYILVWAVMTGFSAQAVDLITATITVTNTPSNGNTLTVNGNVRTWKTSVAAVGTDILIASGIGPTATNLYNHVAAYGFSGPLQLARSGTNAITLRGVSGQSMTITSSATWATITYVTNTLVDTYIVRMPITSEPTANQRTNIASMILTSLQDYPTNTLVMSPSLTNFVDRITSQTISNKIFATNGNYFYGMVSNAVLRNVHLQHTSNNLPIKFYDSAGVLEYAIAADAAGRPSMYYVYSADNTNTAANNSPDDQNILNALSGDFRYGKKSLYANSWTGTNTFTRITNSAIVGSAISQATAIGGTITALTNGYWLSGGITNGTLTNTTLYGTQKFPRTAHTTLASGPNIDVDFSAQTFYEITSGPAAAFTISSMTGGADGRVLIIHNTTAYGMAFLNDTGGTAANRILTGTGLDVYFSGSATVVFIYDSTQLRWIMTAMSEPPTQHASPNTFWAGPVSGNATNATFRAIDLSTADVTGVLPLASMSGAYGTNYNFDTTQFTVGTITNVSIISGVVMTNAVVSGSTSGTWTFGSTGNLTSGGASTIGAATGASTWTSGSAANLVLSPGTTGKVVINSKLNAAGPRKIVTDEVSNAGTNHIMILPEDGSLGTGAGIAMYGYAHLNADYRGNTWIGYGSVGNNPGIRFGLANQISAGTERARIGDSGMMVVSDMSVGATLTGGTTAFTGGEVLTWKKKIKSITAADATLTTLITVTIPAASHSAVLNMKLQGALGPSGTLGARSSTSSGNYDVVITRLSGSTTVATLSAEYGGAAATTATAESLATVPSLAAVTGGAGAIQTLIIKVTLTKTGAGSPTSHTCVVVCELVNAVASGITFE